MVSIRNKLKQGSLFLYHRSYTGLTNRAFRTAPYWQVT